jgi:amphi-Trp domain-containing protein
MKEEKQKNKIEFEGTMELERAIGYLEEALRSMKEGAFSVECCGRHMDFEAAPLVEFEFEAKQKKDKQVLSFEFTWKEGLKAAEDVGFKFFPYKEEAESSLIGAPV